MICPYCKHDNESVIEASDYLVFNCINCNSVYLYPIRKNEVMVEEFVDGKHVVGMPLYNANEIILPKMKIGDSVMCVDNRHPLFLQDGFVRDIKHLHARILFKGNRLIWMNQNIIARMPD